MVAITVSLEKARILKESGRVKDTHFVYEVIRDIWSAKEPYSNLILAEAWSRIYTADVSVEILKAPTMQELIRCLPYKINHWWNVYMLVVLHDAAFYSAVFHWGPSHMPVPNRYENAADSLVLLWQWVKHLREDPSNEFMYYNYTE